MPAGFPTSLSDEKSRSVLSKKHLLKVDFLGAMLLFGTSVLLVVALEEASTQYKWSSATIIVLLVLSVALCMAFVFWEHSLNREGKAQEAVFTWRLMKHRVFMASVA